MSATTIVQKRETCILRPTGFFVNLTLSGHKRKLMYEYREIKPALHNFSQLNQAIYVQAPQKTCGICSASACYTFPYIKESECHIMPQSRSLDSADPSGAFSK